jgi:hypothetical protein
MYKVISPRVFIDTLESFFDEHGGHQRLIASAFAQYILTNWDEYTGSFTDACNVRDILNQSYDLNLPPIDAIQWNLYIIYHTTNYLESN